MNLCYFHREILVQNYDPCREIFRQILRQELIPENRVTPNLMFYHQFPYQNGHMLTPLLDHLHEAIISLHQAQCKLEGDRTVIRQQARKCQRFQEKNIVHQAVRAMELELYTLYIIIYYIIYIYIILYIYLYNTLGCLLTG